MCPFEGYFAEKADAKSLSKVEDWFADKMQKTEDVSRTPVSVAINSAVKELYNEQKVAFTQVKKYADTILEKLEESFKKLEENFKKEGMDLSASESAELHVIITKVMQKHENDEKCCSLKADMKKNYIKSHKDIERSSWFVFWRTS